MVCIGFCIRKPCNCRDIINQQQAYREEKLICAQNRDKGYKCSCVERTCKETVKEWTDRISDNSFENWYYINEKNKAKLINDLKIIKSKALKESNPYRWRYITITLPKDTKPKDVYNSIRKLVLNKPFKEHVYCMEFTGKDMQYHPHIHMIYKKVGKPSHDNKAISRKFKIKDNYIDFKNNIDENQLKGILPYIMGLKTKDKMVQVDEDIKILKKNNLKKYYFEGELFSKLILETNEELQKEDNPEESEEEK